MAPITLTALAVILTGPGASLAQETGMVVGSVLNATTDQPLTGAQIYVEGSTLGTLSDREGRYQLQGIPVGLHRIRAVYLGMGPMTREVMVKPGETAVMDFQLLPTAIALDELVVTATGRQRKRELGTVVGTVNAEQRAEAAPITNAYDLLQAQTPGVQIMNTGGTPGRGSRIRIRGSNSISLSNEPVVYLDGVRIESLSAYSIYVGGMDLGKFNEINPDDIESVEIIKGPSAAALYGTQAANGVIWITTKKGRPGPPRWTAYAEEGLILDPHTYPDNWESLGQDGRDCTNAARANGWCPSVAETHHYTVLEDPRFSPYKTGHRRQYGLNVSGGSGQVNYYVSTDWENEVGPYELPGFYARWLTAQGFPVTVTTKHPQQLTRVNVRANLNAQIADRATLSLSTGYVSSDHSFTPNDNTNQGLVGSGYFGATRRPESGDDDAGAWGGLNPGQVFHVDVLRDAERFTGSGNASWQPLEWLEVRGTLGLDFTGQKDTRHIPPGLRSPRDHGRRNANRMQGFLYTGDFGATGTFRLVSGLESRTSVGAQYVRDSWSGTSIEKEDLVPGTESLSAAAVTTEAKEGTWAVRTLGGYVEENLSFDERLFFSAGLRMDAGSAFGDDYGTALYPKLSLSWILSEEGWFPAPTWVDELRIRGAWGKSGLQPGPTDALRTLRALAFTDPKTGASASGVTINNIGNPELRPESSREFETGLDAGILAGRVGLEVTYYHKHSRDALIERELAPSLGVGSSRWENLGSVKNTGWEGALKAEVINTRHLSWDLTLAGSVNHNEVVDLGQGVEPIGSMLRYVEGFPAGGYWEKPYTFEDTNGDGLISDEEIQVGDTSVFVNRSLPGRELSASGSIRLLDQVTISGLFDYRGDFVVWNLTEFFRCQGFKCSGEMDPDAPPWQQARAVARRFHSTAFGFLEDGSFWKFRELSVSWILPEAWSAVWGASRTRLTVTGRNLKTWTDYSGLDPEVHWDAASASYGAEDLFTQPPVRYWSARLTLSF